MQNNQLTPAIFTPEGQVILDKTTYKTLLRKMFGFSLAEEGATPQQAYLNKAKSFMPNSIEMSKLTDSQMNETIHEMREAFHFLNEWYDLETGRR